MAAALALAVTAATMPAASARSALASEDVALGAWSGDFGVVKIVKSGTSLIGSIAKQSGSASLPANLCKRSIGDHVWTLTSSSVGTDASGNRVVTFTGKVLPKYDKAAGQGMSPTSPPPSPPAPPSPPSPPSPPTKPDKPAKPARALPFEGSTPSPGTTGSTVTPPYITPTRESKPTKPARPTPTKPASPTRPASPTPPAGVSGTGSQCGVWHSATYEVYVKAGKDRIKVIDHVGGGMDDVEFWGTEV